MEHPIIYGVCHDIHVARVTVAGAPTRPGIAAEVFRCLADSDVKSDMAQNTTAPGGRNDLSFVVHESNAATALAVLEQARKGIRFESVSVDIGIGRVAMVGASLRSNSEIIARYFECLRDAEVAVEMVAATDTCISVVTRERDAERAAWHLKSTFQQSEPSRLLHQQPPPFVMLVKGGNGTAP
ncbi:ACT domain-containing protein [Streptomyces sp. NPDC048257]|uniref:ACT domain-containing protein n=1 Tax=Streptomyces sp. NPDC048257 TaxID=3365526 RepID=UPI00371DA5E0